MSPSKEELEDMQNELERLRDQLHAISEKEKDIGESMHPIDTKATALGAARVATAVRNSFIRLNDAGTLMTQIHLDLNVPPTVFHPQAVERATPKEEQEQVTQEVAATQGEQTKEAEQEKAA